MTETRELRPARSGASRPILIGTAILGGIVLAGAGSSAAFGTIANTQGVATATESREVTGIAGIEVDASAADFTIEFGSVTEATLKTSGGRASDWRLERDEDELVVSSPGARFDLCLAWCGWEKRSAVLTLPKELEGKGIEADLNLGAGSMTVRGDFRSIDLDMGAGEAEVVGAVDTFELTLGAGDFTGELHDVSEADFGISAGTANARLTGTAPRSVTIDVAAGDLDIELPDDTYAVQSQVAAGDLTNTLRVDPGSRNRIDIEVSAGDVTIRPGE